MQIGRRMESARKRSGLLQKDACVAIGVSLRSLQSWESGERAAPVTAVAAMVAAYRCSADWLLRPEVPFHALVDPEVEERAVTATDIDQHTEYSQLVAVLISDRLVPVTSQRQFTKRMERVASRGDDLRGETHGKS